MVIASTAGLISGNFAISAMGQAIASLYGVTSGIDEFMDRHIAQMRRSDQPMIERTGRILEATKFGFGLGYLSSVVVIAVGQLLLGNSLTALGTVSSAVIGANPVAMTCAAFGAIYYGWTALSDVERNKIVDAVSTGLSVGVELLKSILSFVIKTADDLMSSSVLSELAESVSVGMKRFGNTMLDMARQSFPSSEVTEDTSGKGPSGRDEERSPQSLLRSLIASDRQGS
jgi:hypothetical protein